MKRTIAGVLTVLSVLVLSGCAITGLPSAVTGERDMTPVETKEFAARLYRTTTDAAGGAWVVQINTWLDCGPDRVQYSLGGRAAGYQTSDPDRLTKKIQGAWARFGIRGEALDTGDDEYGVTYPAPTAHSDERGSSYTFFSRSDGLVFLILTPCMPGDLRKLDPVT